MITAAKYRANICTNGNEHVDRANVFTTIDPMANIATACAHCSGWLNAYPAIVRAAKVSTICLLYTSPSPRD